MATTEEDLNQLERDIRTFKIEFEQYFGGGKKRPPADTEWRIDLVMKRYSERGTNMNSGQRFRYATLAMTYSKYRQMFHKRMQQKEEGVVEHHFGAAAKALEAERARAAAREPARQPVRQVEEIEQELQKEQKQPKRPASFAATVSDPDAETAIVRGLFDAYARAQHDTGETAGRLTLDQFREFIRQKTEQLQKQKSCREVEYRIEVKGGKASLKARVRS
ncbi:MAG: MXAN_5187 C-terminal domain-containing protein [Candidatus Acidiferrales bacterium]